MPHELVVCEVSFYPLPYKTVLGSMRPLPSPSSRPRELSACPYGLLVTHHVELASNFLDERLYYPWRTPGKLEHLFDGVCRRIRAGKGDMVYEDECLPCREGMRRDGATRAFTASCKSGQLSEVLACEAASPSPSPTAFSSCDSPPRFYVHLAYSDMLD